jgi:ankyrin repeat protein
MAYWCLSCFVFEPFDSGILRGRTSLQWPCWNGHLEVCQLLVENGAEVNAKDDEYDTLLYTHALHTHLRVRVYARARESLRFKGQKARTFFVSVSR